MCLPLLLNLTQFSVVFDLNHPKPHQLRGENPATFLEVKKIRLSCHFCLHTHKSSVISVDIKYKWLMAGGQQNRLLLVFLREFQVLNQIHHPKTHHPKPHVRNAGSRSRFPPQRPPTRRWQFFHIRKDSPGSPRLQNFGSPQNLSYSLNKFPRISGFVRTFCWGICQHQDEEYVFRLPFLINQRGTFDASDIQRETSFKNVFSVVRGDLRNKSQIGTLDHL